MRCALGWEWASTELLLLQSGSANSQLPSSLEPHAKLLEYFLCTAAIPQSLLRCRWPKGADYSLDFILTYAMGLANALEHMHYRGEPRQLLRWLHGCCEEASSCSCWRLAARERRR